MRPRWTALLTVVALASAAGGCGADDDLSTDIPRTSPDLTIPSATTENDSADTTTDTTSTTDTTTGTPPAAVTPPAVAPPAAVTPPPAPAPAPPVSTTGGAGAPSGPQSKTGGAQADPEFQNFCRDNPGAPPPC